MIWLASFPRSGNTFLRIILHKVYGIPSSTFHAEADRPLDREYGSFPVVKTHLLPHQLRPSDPAIPAVYLVRDGRDALVSIAHHRSDIVAPGSDFRTNLKEAILAAEGSFFGGWSENVSQWLRRASLVIKFEDLIERPVECAEHLRPFLDLPEPRLEKLPSFEDLRSEDMPYGGDPARRARFFRRGVVGAWKDEMPPDFQGLFWRLHGKIMEELGYLRGQTLGRRVSASVQWRLSAARELAGKLKREIKWKA